MSQYNSILSNKQLGTLSNLQTTSKSDIVSAINELNGKLAASSSSVQGNRYILELARWGVSNIATDTSDATLATNNSNGINSAIVWASQNNYTQFVLPLGTYLIHETIPVEPASFMTLNLNGSTLRIRDNAQVGYSVIRLRNNQQFMRITNGNIMGDRYNHDYYSWNLALNSFQAWTIWQPSKAYSVGDKVMPTNTVADSYGTFWQCTTAGTSGATEPVWTGSTTSGTAVFSANSRHTHEWGMGVLVPNTGVDRTKGQGTNIRFASVDNIEFYNLTGDGVSFFATGGPIYTTNPKTVGYSITFEQGDISTINGSLITNANKVRSNIYVDLTSADIQKFGFFGIYGDISYDSTGGDIDNTLPYDIFFYDSGNNFLFCKKNVEFWDEILLPTGATSCKIVLHQATIPATPNSLTLRCELIPKFFFVEKCHIHHNRRLGVTLQGAKFIWVRNNDIHDIKGTGPDACMDVEDNYAMNQNLWIEDNYFHDQGLLIMMVKGKNFQIRNNKFEYGLVQSDTGVRRLLIENNYWKDCQLNITTEAVVSNNQFTRTNMSILDGDPLAVVVDGNQFWNSGLSVTRNKPYSVTVKNCRFYTDSDSYTLNSAPTGSFNAGTAPHTMTNCTFEGIGYSTNKVFSGATNATEGWSYSNLEFINNSQTAISNRSSLLLGRGTYTNCRFNNPGGMTMVNRVDLIGCTFTWDGYALFANGGADLTRFINCTFKGGSSTALYFSAVTTPNRVEVINSYFEYPAATSTSQGIVDGYWANCVSGGILYLKGNRFTSNLAMKAINNIYSSYMTFMFIAKDNTLEGNMTFNVEQTQYQNFSNNTINGVVDTYNTMASAPTTGFYKFGKQIVNSNMSGTGYSGWVCAKEGFLDTFSAWAPSTSYSWSSHISANGYVYGCVQYSGKSVTTAPTFPTTVGATVYDSVAPAWVASTPYAINGIITPTSSDGSWFYQCTTAGTSGTVQPTWGANTVTDGTVTWAKQTAIIWRNLGATGALFKQFT